MPLAVTPGPGAGAAGEGVPDSVGNIPPRGSVEVTMRNPWLIAAALLVAATACTPNGGSAPAAPVTREQHPSTGATSPPQTKCTGSAARSISREQHRVRLVVTPCRVAPGEAPRLVLANTGNTTLGYSFPFKLEKKTASGWRWINRRQGFPIPLIYLQPGQRSDPERIAVYLKKPTPVRLRPGLYRVSKDLDLTAGKPRPPTITVSGRFRVVAS